MIYKNQMLRKQTQFKPNHKKAENERKSSFDREI